MILSVISIKIIMSTYRKFKTVIYIIGFCLTIFLISKEGINTTHTPPGGFIISVLMILIALVFLIIDLFLKKQLKDFYFHLNTNIISIFVNLIITIGIILT